ncbi:transposase [Acetobacter estunensis NRIC 0472]|uniref:Transposase n=1 Tax=Acetobacter estunensis TaxID=104097 RepID=A0A967B7E5_9PROT|nr:transposase [Acetobacter estunensis]NHO55257.1 transposase [Acetobacter estunensis]GBQ27181.1 transposase [Acetobacter estunensis NRIC 0472]
MSAVREIPSPTRPIWLDDEAISAVEMLFPRGYGAQRSDDRVVLSAIVQVLRTRGLWRELSAEYGLPWKTIYRRFVRWAKIGILDEIFAVLTIERDGRRVLAVTADILNGHGSGALLMQRGLFPLLTELTGDV